MADDFNPRYVKQPDVYAWEGARVQQTFHPAIGNKVAVVFIEAEPGNAAEINTKLAEIAGLAVRMSRKVWIPTAEIDCRPEVDVRVYARTNAPVPVE